MKLKLIDADAINFEKVFVGASDFAKDTREGAQSLIDSQPTAYDVGKVVGQLENTSIPDRYDGMGGYVGKRTVYLDDAIEIVKEGGAEKALGMAISALEELQQYRTIGTLEECQEAREKQILYKVKVLGVCPKCSYDFGWELVNFCPKCGQKLDRSDT